MKAWTRSILASLALLAGATTAVAQPTQRVVVLPFEGKAGDQVRGHVVAALSGQGSVRLVPLEEARDAARQLGVSLRQSSGLVAVARELQVGAFVEGDVVRKSGRWVARIRVRDASTGEVRGREPWPRRSVAQLKAIRGNFWQILGPAILASSEPVREPPRPAARAAAPVAPPRAHEEPSQDETRERPAPAAATGRKPALTVDILPGLMWRRLDYEDPDSGLRGYNNPFGNAGLLVGLETEVYPAARATRSRWGDLGLKAGFDVAAVLSSQYEGSEVGTSAWDFLASAVFRMPVGSFVPKLELGYAMQQFDVDLDRDEVYLPDVRYSTLRAGAGCSFRIRQVVGLELGLAYMHVLDAGNLYSERYFPDASGYAIDVESAVVYHVKPYLGVMLGVDYRRYASTLHPDPEFEQLGGEKFARKANDRYVKLDFGLRFQLGS